MKKQLLPAILFLFSIMSVYAQPTNNKYEKEWEQIEQLEKEDLPRSALDIIDRILNNAVKSRNNSQVIKALVYKNKLNIQIDYDTKNNLLSDLSNSASKSNNECEKALLYSMLAELYLNYYKNDHYTINKRTKLTDTIPDDIEEWTGNIFTDKIAECLELSIKDKNLLKKHTTEDYNDIIHIGKDKIRYPTLYDFLMKRAIEISQGIIHNSYIDPLTTGVTIKQLTLPADEYIKLQINADSNYEILPFIYYQQYIKDLLARNMQATVIDLEIGKTKFLDRVISSFTADDALEVYKQLEQYYEKNENCSEIINMIAEQYGDLKDIPSAEQNKIKYFWLKKGLSKYPKSYGARKLDFKLKVMEMPSLCTQGAKLYYPDDNIRFSIIYKNTQKDSIPSFKLYQVINGKCNIIKEFTLNLRSGTTYNTDTLFSEIGNLPIGKYVFSTLDAEKLDEINNKPYDSKNSDSDNSFFDNNKVDFVVSALASFTRNSAQNEYEIFVADRNTGKPSENALIKVFAHQTDTLLSELRTNIMGIATFKDNKNTEDIYNIASYTVSLDQDSSWRYQDLTNNNYNWKRDVISEKTKKNNISIFTDRNIYRPGQTVYFKAVITDHNSNIIPGKKCNVVLYDNIGNHVSNKEIITNDFGSVSGEFAIPKSGLSGLYKLFAYTEDGSDNYVFSVEEYKRPTFEVSFDNMKETFTLGNEIKLNGYAKSFAGEGLQNVEVKYAITRQLSNSHYWNSPETKTFEDNTTITNKDGSFVINFIPQGEHKENYIFKIQVNVTDRSGETQTNTHVIEIGNVPMFVDIDIPEKIEKSEKNTLIITARNSQRTDIDRAGTYILYYLNENNTIKDSISEGLFRTNIYWSLDTLINKLPSGKYRLKVKIRDKKEAEVIQIKDFILFGYGDTELPVKTNKWIVEKKTIFDENSPAEVLFGVSDNDIHVIYRINDRFNIFEQHLIKMSNEIRLFKIPYQKEYGENVFLSFQFVKNGELYSHDVNLKKSKEDISKKLDLKLEVFRDKLRPGQYETWTISVKDNDKNFAVAELLASMYDVSLDKIRRANAWIFNYPRRAYRDYFPPVSFSTDYHYRYNARIQSFSFYTKPYRSNTLLHKLPELKPLPTIRRFDQLNWFGCLYVDFEPYIYNKKELKKMGREYTISSIDRDAVAPETLGFSLNSSINRLREADTPLSTEEPSGQIRQNFNETAFFYPQLQTDENGEVKISFTVPDSNTKWRFRALAHDKNMRTGSLHEFITTNKELMVVPNMPRFVRIGDKTSISAKITNLSEEESLGDIHIEFFDPETEKIIEMNVTEQKKRFFISGKSSGSVSWSFTVPGNIEFIGCRIIARNEIFSDGEQHIIPVLSDRISVTESVPISITNSGTEDFILEKLYNKSSQSITNNKLIFEYTSNPAWYAVQSLPALINSKPENAIDRFVNYYINSIGMIISEKYPQIVQTIKHLISLNEHDIDGHSVTPKQNRKDKLKDTPWIKEFDSEDEKIKNIALLFDKKHAEFHIDAALKKLSELNLGSENGWAWYKGMEANRALTHYILYGFTKLKALSCTEYMDEIKEAQFNAVRYIDKEILSDFQNIEKTKNSEKISYISTCQLEYLYVRSFYNEIPMDEDVQAACLFFTDAAVSNRKNLNLYECAILSIILNRRGNKDSADRIIKSIREYAVTDARSGMYWPNNKYQIFMSMSDVSLHTFLMEALSENGASVDEINLLNRWLIRRKQAQMWESPHATIDAIMMLIKTGTNLFEENYDLPIVKVGKTKLAPKDKRYKINYFRKEWNGADIKSNMGKVTITNKNQFPAYGALYLQYDEDIDKVTKQTGELNINKQIFTLNETLSGQGLTHINENSCLKPGDKVVIRLTIRTSRDMEFVQVKDMRAPCFEPVQTISGIRWNGDLRYYQELKDTSTDFYFDYLPKGTYILEYPVYIDRAGVYNNGISTIQCLYAPEFISHTENIKVTVSDK